MPFTVAKKQSWKRLRIPANSPCESTARRLSRDSGIIPENEYIPAQVPKLLSAWRISFPSFTLRAATKWHTRARRIDIFSRAFILAEFAADIPPDHAEEREDASNNSACFCPIA